MHHKQRGWSKTVHFASLHAPYLTVDQRLPGAARRGTPGRLLSGPPNEFVDLTLHQDAIASGCGQSHCLELAILLRVVPAVRMLQRGEPDQHREGRLPVTFQHLAIPAHEEVAALVLLDRGQDPASVLLQPGRIGDLANVEEKYAAIVFPSFG
jgi:hypothetical protein